MKSQNRLYWLAAALHRDVVSRQHSSRYTLLRPQLCNDFCCAVCTNDKQVAKHHCWICNVQVSALPNGFFHAIGEVPESARHAFA
jgi:hypothetical protein